MNIFYRLQFKPAGTRKWRNLGFRDGIFEPFALDIEGYRTALFFKKSAQEFFEKKNVGGKHRIIKVTQTIEAVG